MPIFHRLQPTVQIPQILFEVVTIRRLGHAVHSHGRILAYAVEGSSQRFLVYQMSKGKLPLVRISLGSPHYP
jgi:hypothetical protein